MDEETKKRIEEEEKVRAEERVKAEGDLMEEKKKEENIFIPTTQGKRFLNLILDLVFIHIFAFCFWFLSGFIITLLFGVSGELFVLNLANSIEDMSDFLYNFILMTIFYLTCELIWSKTPAKFITKTRVITENGEKPEFGTILKRTLLRFIPFEAFSFLTSGRPIGWHDAWSKTIVVDENAFKAKKISQYDKTFYCSQCGNNIDERSLYCIKCGSKTQ